MVRHSRISPRPSSWRRSGRCTAGIWAARFGTWIASSNPLQAFSEYIRLEPGDPAGYKERAEVYDALGEEQLAKADWAKFRALGGKEEE